MSALDSASTPNGVEVPDFDRPVISVWSSYGHTFMGGDTVEGTHGRESYVSCLTCGGEFVERNLGDGRGEYVTYGIDETPIECSLVRGVVHGIERVCEADNGRACHANETTGVCVHTEHDCNCVMCHV